MAQSDPLLVARKLKRLQAGYLLHLSEFLRVLGIYAQSCSGGILSQEQRASLLELVHKLAGSGGTYGFPSISENAQAFEALLRSNPALLQDTLLEKIRALSAVCSEAMTPLLQEKTEETSLAHRVNTTSDQDQKPLVLAVDDDPAVRLAIELLLEENAQVVTGKNSSDALYLMRELKPSLVLLDDIMPGGVTGLSLLEQIKGDKEISTIPVIMVTASSNEADVLRGLMAGAIDYITKPFTPDSLVNAVTAFLARKQQCLLLMLRNSSLCHELQERLVELNCTVSSCNSAVQALEAAICENNIIVADSDSLTIEQAGELLSKTPSAQLLYLSSGREAGASSALNGQITMMTNTHNKDSILREIGLIIRRQKDRAHRDSTALSLGETHDSK